jgi:phosphotriesterase-related protein
MTQVNTVLGTIDSTELGAILLHEHLAISSAGIPQVFPQFMDKNVAREAGVQALDAAYAEGIRSYVDVTTMDLGRDMGVIKAIAEQSNVHVIIATGIWLDIPRALITGVTVDQLATAFVREIEVGIENTDIKAGVIKVATSEQGVTPANELVLRAASRAAIHTGVPISTHTSASAKVGNDQIAIFEDEGVNLKKVYIGHSDGTDDLEYLRGLGDKQCIIGMDTYGSGINWEERTAIVAALIEQGYETKLALSHDIALSSLRVPDQESTAPSNPDGICLISRKVLPRLRELGISDRSIETMMVAVGKNLFEGN